MKTNDIQNNGGRALVETGVIIKVGLDVHAVKIAACAQIDGTTAQPAQVMAREGLLPWLAKLRAKHPARRW